MKKSEFMNVFTHSSGAILMIIGTIILCSISNDIVYLSVSLIYGISSILLFTSSAVYHIMKKGENEKSIWRTFDHISIYIMIAGTYTPICIVQCDKSWGISILSIQWGLALCGLLSELFWRKRPRWISTILYMVMGWVIIAAIAPLSRSMPQSLFVFLITGGIIYSLGAVVYAMKKPNPIPGFFGFHEIFHSFVLLANGFFFVVVYQIVKT